MNIPGCNQQGQLFVGQRKEPFAVNLGTIFDLVNAPVSVITDPCQRSARCPTPIDDANITTLALEVHKSCLTRGNDPVIGGWTTASMRQGALSFDKPESFGSASSPTTRAARGRRCRAWACRLVNEVVIGLPDKDLLQRQPAQG